MTEVTLLLHQAETALEAGNLTEALDLLRQVHELQPDEPEIAARYARLQQRARLEKRLREAEADYRQKLATDSPVDARDALRQGLRALLEPGTGLPDEAQTALLKLIQLSEQEQGLVLSYPEEWEEGRKLLARLGRMETQHILAGRAYYLADLWARLAHDVAMRGVIESAAKLGKLLEAYRGATIYIQMHPTEPDAVALLTQTGEELLRRYNESVTKRLKRAREALREGLYPTALSNLAAVEEEFYGPIAQEFPDLLEKEPQVEQLRREAERLQTQAERLQALHEQVQPHLQAAEQTFVSGDLEAAEAELRAVPDLREAPNLAQRVEDLRGRIAQARTEQARQALYEALTTAQIGLRLATTREQFDDLSEALGEVSRRVNLRLLPVEEREAYHRMLDEVQEQRREMLVGGATWEAQAEQALQAGNYLQAAAALEKAVAATREGDKWVQLQAQLEEVQGLAQRQQRQQEALQRGHEFLAQGEYSKAVKSLSEAFSLGVDVEDFLRAAQAGQFLVTGRAKLDAGELVEAELVLQQALIVGQNREPAYEIVREAYRLLNELTFAKVERMVEQAWQAAAQLFLRKAELLIEQARESVGRLELDSSLLISNPMRSHVIAQANLLRDIVHTARDLWRTVLEAQSYLAQDVQSEEAFRLLHEVLMCPDENEVIYEIKQRVTWLLAGKDLLEGDYEALERLLLRRIANNRDDRDAWANLQWLRAQRKLDQEWKATQDHSQAFSEEIADQLEAHRVETVKDARIWKWVSILAAVMAFGLLAYAVIFLTQWREPLSYLSTLPAILVGVAAPFIHDHYIRTVEQVNAHAAQALKQWKQHMDKENQRRQDMFSAMLSVAQQPPFPETAVVLDETEE